MVCGLKFYNLVDIFKTIFDHNDLTQVTEHIESLVQLMDFRGRWDPIDRFIKLGGVQLMLQV